MDRSDIALLRALQEDGSLTNQELADRVGLSASQCSRRRAALVEDGVIAGYTALIEPEAVGLGVTVFVQVSLVGHSAENSRRFQRLIDGLEEVQEAYALSGEADYMLKLVVTDLAALARILNDALLAHETVARVRSSIVLNRLKRTTRLPLGHLRPDSPRKASDPIR